MFLRKTILGGLILMLLLALGGIGSRLPERPAPELTASQGRSQLLALPVLNVPRVRHVLHRVHRGVRRRVRWLRRFVPLGVRSRLRHNLAGFLHGSALAAPHRRDPIPPDGNHSRRD